MKISTYKIFEDSIKGKSDDNDSRENRIVYSKDLESVLVRMEDDMNYVAFEMLWLNDPTSRYNNDLGISKMGISKKPYHFDVTINGKGYDMKIGEFLRYYWPGIFTSDDIRTFANLYNDLTSKGISGNKSDSSQKVVVPPFSYNPKDVRSTFLSLTTKTYPYGHDEEVLEFLPKDLKMDSIGNYYKIIGSDKPKVMFTSHLDTADSNQKETSLYSVKGRVEEEGYSFRLVKSGTGDEHIYTDGTSILGADDKSGITVMLYMMAHNVPGIYYFFIGEERGGIGSRALSSIYDRCEYLTDVKACVSFDRRRTTSVITHQMSRRCCSDDFGQFLCDEYNKNGLNLSLDTTGVFTDSASFIEDIAECTNISVGYYNEHRNTEMQNISYLERLAKASVKVNWDKIPVKRKIGYNEELYKKWKSLIDEIKKNVFGIEVKVIGKDDRIFISIDLEQIDIEEIYDALIRVQTILNKYKVSDVGVFDDTYFKIELR
jgi:transcriptional regulator with XRE-family HTH domain